MQWFEDDDFWSTFADYIYSEDRLKNADAEIEGILALAQPAARDVLDLCCGTGRHAAALARRGFRVTGVDRLPMALHRARAHVIGAGLDVEFVESDMRAFVRPGAFDLAVNLFTSFGYFERAEDELLVLRNVRTSLRPGGTFVLDVMGKEVLARGFQDTRSAVAPDGTLIVWRTAVADDWTRIHGEWVALGDGTARRFRVDHWIYSGGELRALLCEAGFKHVRLYGGFDGRAYDLGAQRLVAVAAA